MSRNRTTLSTAGIALLAFLVVICGIGSALGADVTMSKSMTGGSYNDSQYWGGNAVVAGNDYFVGLDRNGQVIPGQLIRTNSNLTFNGGVLYVRSAYARTFVTTFDYRGGCIMAKGSSNTNATIPEVHFDNGRIWHGNGGATLGFKGTFVLDGDLYYQAGENSNRHIRFQSDTKGSGIFTINNRVTTSNSYVSGDNSEYTGGWKLYNGPIYFQGANAVGQVGSVYLGNNARMFVDSPVNLPEASLTIDATNAYIVLQVPMTFSHVQINGISLNAGTYTAEELVAAFPASFRDVGGSITVVDGAAANLVVEPDTLDFGLYLPSTNALDHEVLITNQGSSDVAIDITSFDFSQMGEFVLKSVAYNGIVQNDDLTTTALTLMGGDEIAIMVGYTPATEIGPPATGKIVLATSDPNNPTKEIPISASITQWKTRDIGSVGVPGAIAVDSETTLTLTASGDGIVGSVAAGTLDSFSVAYKALAGDGSISARIVSVDPTASVAISGVYIAETITRPNAKIAAMVRHPFIDDINAAMSPGLITRAADQAVPVVQEYAAQWALQYNQQDAYYVKVARAGNMFTGYFSVDGVTWLQIGQPVEIDMAQEVFLGLVGASGVNAVRGASVIDMVEITGAVSAAANPAALYPSMSRVGKVAHFDAADLANMKNGEAVGMWPNKNSDGPDFVENANTFNSSHDMYPNLPTYVTDTVHGNPVVRFDGTRSNNTGDFLQTEGSTRIYARTIFLVMNELPGQDTALDFFLCDVSDYQFHGGSNYRIIDSGNSHANVNNGAIWINGTKYDRRTSPDLFGIDMPKELSVVVFATRGEVHFNRLAWDRAIANRFFGADCGEIIVYDRLLSNDEISKSTDYLMYKWGVVPPTLKVSPTDLNFGSATPGGSPHQMVVDMRNDGLRSADVLSVSVEGAGYSAAVTMDGQPVSLPITLMETLTAEVTVTFVPPVTSGITTGTMTIITTDPANTTITIPLRTNHFSSNDWMTTGGDWAGVKLGGGLDNTSFVIEGTNPTSYTIINASGADFWGTSDGGYYVYKMMTGDGEITAQAGSVFRDGATINTWAKFGIMMRNSLDDNSRNVNYMKTPAPPASENGATFEWRLTDGAASYSNQTNTLDAMGLWMRLRREGNVFKGYNSYDKVNWTYVGSQYIEMNDTIYVGFATTAHDNAAEVTSGLRDLTDEWSSIPVAAVDQTLLSFGNVIAGVATTRTLRISESNGVSLDVLAPDTGSLDAVITVIDANYDDGYGNLTPVTSYPVSVSSLEGNAVVLTLQALFPAGTPAGTVSLSDLNITSTDPNSPLVVTCYAPVGEETVTDGLLIQLDAASVSYVGADQEVTLWPDLSPAENSMITGGTGPLFTPHLPNNIPLVNPGFELPDAGKIVDGMDGGVDVPGWKTAKIGSVNNGLETVPYEGGYSAYLDGGAGDTDFYQVTDHLIVADYTYQVRFFMRDGNADVQLRAYEPDGVNVAAILTTASLSRGDWALRTLTFTVPTTATGVYAGKKLGVSVLGTSGWVKFDNFEMSYAEPTDTQVPFASFDNFRYMFNDDKDAFDLANNDMTVFVAINPHKNFNDNNFIFSYSQNIGDWERWGPVLNQESWPGFWIKGGEMDRNSSQRELKFWDRSGFTHNQPILMEIQRKDKWITGYVDGEVFMRKYIPLDPDSDFGLIENLTLGTERSGPSSWGSCNYELGSLMIWNRALTEVERNQIGSTLATKFGATGSVYQGAAAPTVTPSTLFMPGRPVGVEASAPLSIRNVVEGSTFNVNAVTAGTLTVGEMTLNGVVVTLPQTLNAGDELIVNLTYTAANKNPVMDTVNVVTTAGNVAVTAFGGNTPPVTAGLKLLLDVASLAGLSTGDPVPVWSDISGNGHNFSQDVVDSQPTFIANGPLGKPVVRFDGVNDFLGEYPNKIFNVHWQEGTLVFVLAVNDPVNGGGGLFYRGNTTLGEPWNAGRINCWLGNGGGDSNVRGLVPAIDFGWMGWSRTNTPIIPSTQNVIVWAGSGATNPNTANWYINGIETAYSDNSIETENSGFGLRDPDYESDERGFWFGRGREQGATYSDKVYFNGDISKVLYFDRQLSEEEVQLLSSDLNAELSVLLNATPKVTNFPLTNVGDESIVQQVTVTNVSGGADVDILIDDSALTGFVITAGAINGAPVANLGAPITLAANGADELVLDIMVNTTVPGAFNQILAFNATGDLTGIATTVTLNAAVSDAWLSQDIGRDSGKGYVIADGTTTYSIFGAGADIWGEEDAFHYMYRSLTGDGSISARIISTQKTNDNAKAGVMMRTGAVGAAANVLARRPSDAATPGAQHRDEAGAESYSDNGANANGQFPLYEKIERIGDNFLVSDSIDGVTWAGVTTYTIKMDAEILIGIVMTSHVNNTIGEAVVDSIQTTGNVGIPTPLTPGTRLYVDAAATGTNDGLSWDNAMTDVRTAIHKAAILNIGAEIWVAAGYYPTTGTLNLISNTSIVGGFLAGATDISESKPQEYFTILDQVAYGHRLFDVYGADNTSLKGLVLTNEIKNTSIGTGNNGGIIKVQYVENFLITDCMLVDGRSREHGAGMVIDDAHGVVIRNTVFAGQWNNTANGGVDDVNPDGSDVVDSGTDVAVIYQADDNSDLLLENCLFAGNVAGRGAALWTADYSQTDVVNCTFAGNMTTLSNGLIHANTYALINVTNSIIANNDTPDNVFDGLSVVTSNNLLWNNTAPAVGGRTDGASDITGDPMFGRSITGTWASVEVQGPYTVLVANGSPFKAEGSQVGQLVDVDTAAALQYLILQSTPNTLVVLGNVAAVAGANFEIPNYDISVSGAAADAGAAVDITDDILGRDRPYGAGIDIGAFEAYPVAPRADELTIVGAAATIVPEFENGLAIMTFSADITDGVETAIAATSVTFEGPLASLAGIGLYADMDSNGALSAGDVQITMAIPQEGKASVMIDPALEVSYPVTVDLLLTAHFAPDAGGTSYTFTVAGSDWTLVDPLDTVVADTVVAEVWPEDNVLSVAVTPLNAYARGPLVVNVATFAIGAEVSSGRQITATGVNFALAGGTDALSALIYADLNANGLVDANEEVIGAGSVIAGSAEILFDVPLTIVRPNPVAAVIVVHFDSAAVGVQYTATLSGADWILDGAVGDTVVQTPDPVTSVIDPIGPPRYELAITVPGYSTGTAVTDIAVLVTLTSGTIDFSTFGSSNGYDLYFMAADQTTVLNHEIDSWDSTLGIGNVWVKLSTLASDTVFYAYWGNPLITEPAAYTQNGSIWGDNARVYHLQDDTPTAVGVVVDSGPNNHNLRDSALALDTAGVVGNAQLGEGENRINDYLAPAGVLPRPGVGSYTVSFWMKPFAQPATHSYVATMGNQTDDGAKAGWSVRTTTTGTIQLVGNYVGGDATTDWLLAGPSAGVNEWAYVTYVFDRVDQKVRGYVNGASIGEIVLDPAWDISMPEGEDQATNFGRPSGSANNPFSGSYDELRIEVDVAPTAEQIWATYLTMANGGITTYSTVLTAPVVVVEPTLDAGDDITLVVGETGVVGGPNTTSVATVEWAMTASTTSSINSITPSVTFNPANSLTPTVSVSPSFVGTYEVTLSGTYLGSTVGTPDTVMVTVTNDIPAPQAGADQSITSVPPVVALNGSVTDIFPGVVDAVWSIPAGGELVALTGDLTDLNPTVQLPEAGLVYTLRLTVTDGDGATSYSELTVTSAIGERVFVDGTATGLGSGISWTNAATTFASGLEIADASGLSEVWVAEGTYTESLMVPDGVSLYGGFAGTEITLDERAGGVSTISAAGLGVPAVIMIGVGNVTLDGFTISGANVTAATVPIETANVLNGLVGYYTFEDSLLDMTSNGNDGTIEGAPAFDTDVPGPLASSTKSVLFDGVDDMVLLSQNSGLPISGAPVFSIAMWVKGAADQNDKRFFSEGDTGGNNNPLFNLGTNNATPSSLFAPYIRTDSGTALSNHPKSVSDVFDSAWHHVAWVDNGGEVEFYVDGVLDGGSFDYTRGTITTNVTSLGGIRRAASGSWFAGAVDDVAIYRNKALTVAEVGSLAAGGSAFLPATVSGGGLHIVECDNTVVINNCIITNNTTDVDGAGALIASSDITITNSTISGNTAGNGGALGLDNSDVTIVNCVITGNTASNAGGAIIAATSDPSITNSTIANNTSPFGSAVLAMNDGDVTLLNSIITGNTGVVLQEFDASSNITASFCLFDNPAATTTLIDIEDIDTNDMPLVTPRDASAPWLRYTTDVNLVPAEWNTVGFDDSGWDDGTIVDPWDFSGFGPGTGWDDNSDLWARRTFELTTMPLVPRIIMALDDNAWVYVNGVLVLAETDGWNNEQDYPISTDPLLSALVIGTNTIAVQAHEGSGGNMISIGIKEFAPVVTVYTSIDDAQTSVTNITDNMSGDPAFVSSENFQITASSVAVDAGTANGAPSTDRNGVLRPVDIGNIVNNVSAFDIGAYELQKAQDILVSPTTLNFGVQPWDAGPTAPMTVTISSNGTNDLTISEIEMVGVNVADYATTFSGLAVIPSGDTLEIPVEFDPLVRGLKNASLIITSTDIDRTTVSVTLIGYAAPTQPTNLDLSAVDDSGSSSVDDLTNNMVALTISGDSEAGTVVTIKETALPVGEQWLAWVLAEDFPAGIDIVLPTDGIHELTATAIAVEGFESIESDPLAIIIDTTAPIPPSGIALAAADDQGYMSDDMITNQMTSLTITGVTVTTDSLVTLLVDGSIVTSGSAATFVMDGFDINLTEGTHAITATETDMAGNTSLASMPSDLVVDITAPTVLSIVPEDVGPTNADNLAVNVTFDSPVTGFTSVNDLVVVFSNEASTMSITGAIFTAISPTEYRVLLTGIVGTGDMTVAVGTGAQDYAGNASIASAPSVVIEIDNTIPEIVPEPAWTMGLTNTVEWLNMADATTYTMQIASDDQFTTTSVLSEQNISAGTLEATFTDLTDGMAYYYRLRANVTISTTPTQWSESTFSTQDATAPVGTIVINGGDEYATAPVIALTLTSDEPGTVTASGVAEMRFSDGLGWTAWVPVADTATFELAITTATEGVRTVTAEFKDLAGNVSVGIISDTIKLDTDAPIAPATVADAGEFTNVPELVFTWDALVDVGIAPVASVEVVIATDAAFADIVSNASLAADAVSTSLTGVSGTSYFVRVWGIDAAGNVGLATDSDGVLVDTEAPDVPAAPTAPEYTNTDMIDFVWTAVADPGLSGVDYYSVQVATDDAFASIVLDTMTPDLMVTYTSGTDATMYYARVMSVDKAGNASVFSATSLGTMVDLTSPTVTAVTLLTVTPTNADVIEYSVTFSEEVTGFGDAGDVVVNNAGTANTGVTIVADSATSYTYTVSVTGVTGDGTLSISIPAGVCTDLAGNPNEPYLVTADVAVDNSVPEMIAEPVWTAGTENTVSWTPVANVVTYSVAISETADFAAATVVDVDTSTTMNTFTDLTDGQIYYYRVRATKVSTFVTDWSTDVNSTQDATVPTVTVSINDGAEFATDANVDVTILSDDAGTTPSGVAEYRLDAGTGFTSWSLITGTTMTQSVALTTDGLATIVVEVRDNALNVSASASDDITLDTVVPAVVSITALTASPSNANIVEYEVTFDDAVTGFDSSDDVLLTLTGETTVTEVVITAQSDTVYTVSIMGVGGNGAVAITVNADVASDVAGNMNTAAGPSDAVVIDSTTPIMIAEPEWTSGTENTVAWDALDGADSYLLTVYDNADLTSEVTSAQITSPTLEGTATDLVDGTTYWYTVAAIKGAFTTAASAATSSTQDASAPTTVTLAINDGAAITTQTPVTLTVSAMDSGSGVDQIRVNLGTGFSDWVAFTETIPATLPDGAGEKVVGIEVMDAVGNISALTTSSIELYIGDPAYTLAVTAGTGGSVTIDPEQAEYSADTEVLITAVPDEGYVFTAWTGDIPAGSETATSATIVMNADKTIEATFELAPVTLTLLTDGPGGASATPFAPYVYGAEVTLTATPDANAIFSGWTGDIDPADAMVNPITITLNGDKTVTANFVEVVTLTLNVVGDGSLDVAAVTTYTMGSQVTVTATANDPATTGLGAWSGDVAAGNENDNPLTITMDGDKTITASFVTLGPWTLDVLATNGSVDITPTQATYEHMSTVELIATADAHYSFAGWSGVAAGQEMTNPITVTMDDNKAITATFVVDQHTVTFEPMTNGVVTLTPANETYAYGSTITLVATPEAGYLFGGWIGNFDCMAKRTNPITITVTGDMVIGAGFIPEPAALIYAITAKNCTLTGSLAAGLVIQNGTTKSSVKIAYSKKGLPTGVTLVDGMAADLKKPTTVTWIEARIIDQMTINGDVKAFLTNCPIDTLTISGAAKSITTKNAALSMLVAGGVGSVKVTAIPNSTDTTEPVVAYTAIQMGNQYPKASKITMTGAVLCGLSADGVQISKISIATKNLKDKVSKVKYAAFGGIEGGDIMASTIKTLSVKGGDIAPASITTTLAAKSMKISGAAYKTSPIKTPKASNISGSIMVSVAKLQVLTKGGDILTDLIYVTGELTKVSATAKYDLGGLVGNGTGQFASGTAGIKNVIASNGINGLFIAGSTIDDGEIVPNMGAEIGTLKSKLGTIDGQTWSSNPTSIKIKGTVGTLVNN